MLLGRHTPVVERYAPEVLYPIPRAGGRAALGCEGASPFSGTDLWHAYEMSWLDAGGMPVVRVGRLSVPATSPNLVESKSFKLYLNSLNNTRFASEEEVAALVRQDIAGVVGCEIELDLLEADHPSLAGRHLAGRCLDELKVAVPEGEPICGYAAAAPWPDGGGASLHAPVAFPVSGDRPARLGQRLDPLPGHPAGALLVLRYIIAYRRHQEFHEQCVERMFCDIHRPGRPRVPAYPGFLHPPGRARYQSPAQHRPGRPAIAPPEPAVIPNRLTPGGIIARRDWQAPDLVI